ncbi:hypothetical protein DY000_02006903 [Brassica cretica]|uniref:Uncharacterized protein n=1 Tax=Brassica cretica TaxID=69181 RepID=A0ABQ7CAM2_BRACR|nr:hypothetical protein DY000_02006903 [Brassica cretica]
MEQDVHRSIIIFNRRGLSSVSIDGTGCASIDCFFFVLTSNDNHPDGTQRKLFNLQRWQDQQEDRRLLRDCENRPNGKSTASSAIVMKPNGKSAVSSAIMMKPNASTALSSAHGNQATIVEATVTVQCFTITVKLTV